jgi:hypothetical protein
MSAADLWSVVWGTLQVLAGLASSTIFVLVLFIGFCVLVGFTKLKKTAGSGALVVKSLDETTSNRPFTYLAPSAPRGPADQLRSPELVEASSRK